MCLLLCAYSVPETRGKSLEEIEDALGVNKYDD